MSNDLFKRIYILDNKKKTDNIKSFNKTEKFIQLWIKFFPLFIFIRIEKFPTIKIIETINQLLVSLSLYL